MVIYPQIDTARLELAKEQLKKKTLIWLSFLFFGWSYGSLGKLGIQFLWYTIVFLSLYGIYENSITNNFTVFAAIAAVALPIWVIWSITRLFTLNKAIRKYNEKIADYYGLNPEEKEILGLD